MGLLGSMFACLWKDVNDNFEHESVKAFVKSPKLEDVLRNFHGTWGFAPCPFSAVSSANEVKKAPRTKTTLKRPAASPAGSGSKVRKRPAAVETHPASDSKKRAGR